MLKLLLAMVMVIQPVSFSYAMANMALGHDHSGNALMAHNVQSQSHDDQHAMSHGLDKVADAQHQNQHDDDNAMNDCCATPACGAAVILSFVATTREVNSEYYSSLDASWKGIALPAEIKPPRSLLG